MKNIFGILLLAVLPVAGWAQGDTSKLVRQTYVGLDVGVCYSPSQLFQPSANTAWSDYINPGFAIDLAARFPLFHSNFGFAANVAYYYNTFDMSKYVSYNTPTATSQVSSVSYGSFFQIPILLGASYMHNFNKFSLEIKALAGLDLLTLPNTEIESKNIPSQPAFTTTEIYKANPGFTYGGDISLSYMLAKNLSAIFTINVLFDSFGYSDNQYKDYLLGVDYPSSGSYATTISMMTTMLGVRYEL